MCNFVDRCNFLEGKKGKAWYVVVVGLVKMKRERRNKTGGGIWKRRPKELEK